MSIESLRFLAIGSHEPALPWHMGAHVHTSHELIFILSGGQHTLLANREYFATEGDILIYPAGLSHEESSDTAGFRSVFMTFEWTRLPPEIPLLIPDKRGRVRMLMTWMLEDRDTPTTFTHQSSNTLLNAVLHEILHIWQYPEDNLVVMLRAYIKEHLTENLTLNTLAGIAGLSKYHFIRRYKRLTGRSPMTDVRFIRLARARELIMTTPFPLKAIAPLVGLGDEYHMSRLFKRYLGIRPGSLRSNAWFPHHYIKRA
ncbi:MAG: helix-turn-helix transcriptional regulator [Lentisphaerae bacterium]|nr:helix-turn-helix transcriptional regulator [Lentisphaerota bacterium]